MKVKKVIALIICSFFLFMMIAGCATPDDDIIDEPVYEPTITPVEVNEPYGYDYNEEDEDDFYPYDIDIVDFDAAIATFPPDTVMIRADNLVITWAELYVYLFNTFTETLNAFGTEIDLANEDSDLADLILEHSTDSAVSLLVYLYGFHLLNVEVTDEDLAVFNDDIAAIIEIYGGVEELENNLRATSGFYDFEVFVTMFKNEYYVNLLIDQLYGGDDVAFFDEIVTEYAEENGYMMALHILRMKTDGDDEIPRGEAENILERLIAQVDSDDFIDYFIELMFEYSEDEGGLMSFPEGYLFQHADMVAPFSNASEELGVGELSGVVETDFGFHIILRVPIDYDTVPIGVSSMGMSTTLRQIAALDNFEALQREWRDSINLEFTPEYYSIDIASVFRFNTNS